jgi:glycosyltransferase involved in cell wall biosynthesis
MKSPKILFISHDASLTGAPIMLLRMLRWLSAHTDFTLDVMLLSDGPLADAFASVGNVYHWRPWWKPGNRIARGVRYLGHECQRRLGSKAMAPHLDDPAYSAIYVNSMACSFLFAHGKRPSCPVVMHVHELASVASRYMDRGWDDLCSRASRFVFPSHSALNQMGQIAPAILDRSVILPNFIENLPVARLWDVTREQLGIPRDAFVIGASGGASLVKGMDWLPLLMNAVGRLHPTRPLFFLWVGAEPDAELVTWVKHDLLRLGCGAAWRILPRTLDPIEYYGCFDVFALLSREESFCLALIEAASLGIPAVCFDRVGGACEFIGNSAGFVVPYADFGAMATRIVELCDNPSLHEQMGRAGLAKVEERYTAACVGPRLVSILKEVMTV